MDLYSRLSIEKTFDPNLEIETWFDFNALRSHAGEGSVMDAIGFRASDLFSRILDTVLTLAKVFPADRFISVMDDSNIWSIGSSINIGIHIQ